MVWNCRGAASNAFYRYCKIYVDRFKPSMLVIVETRCDPNIITKSLMKLGYDTFKIISNWGFAGGIAMAWKSNAMDVFILENNDQFIHSRIKMEDSNQWFFTAIYARPQENSKKMLWDDLKEISNNMREPWMMAGDFNDIAYVSDKRGGVAHSLSRCKRLRDRMDMCKVRGVEAKGPKFTWRGPIFSGGQRIYEKLDRALSNDDWRLMFPDSFVKVLMRFEFSDHHPILISLKEETRNVYEKKFCFENAWLTHETYDSMLKYSWNTCDNIGNNLKRVVEGINKWKFANFDTIKEQKKEIMRWLEGIQRNLQMHDNVGGMRRLEHKLQRELSYLVNQEELMWHQRSRTKWLVDGDRNTKFYYMQIVSRWKRNRILMLKNDDGEWISEQETLKQHCTEFYKKLFACPSQWCTWYQTPVSYPKLSMEDLNHLNKEIVMEEFKHALFTMKPWKAPGRMVFLQDFIKRLGKL
ncbi:uncharacterized protein LOC131659557 [Vicia villosa]|uniref:uncharacterized protein LOC131659557 n=1 Tax=Vicia villosa TaxID=3911 RepID=UPI00273AFE5F|nr:uncharacterized protein LOC131659557 [Vicia villosa]